MNRNATAASRRVPPLHQSPNAFRISVSDPPKPAIRAGRPCASQAAAARKTDSRTRDSGSTRRAYVHPPLRRHSRTLAQRSFWRFQVLAFEGALWNAMLDLLLAWFVRRFVATAIPVRTTTEACVVAARPPKGGLIVARMTAAIANADSGTRR